MKWCELDGKVKTELIHWPYEEFHIETPSMKPGGTAIYSYRVNEINKLVYRGVTYTLDGKISHSFTAGEHVREYNKHFGAERGDIDGKKLEQELTSLVIDLICILARPGTARETTENKAMKHLRERAKHVNQRARYITTLSIGTHARQAPRGEPTGATRIPHDRRGHYRTQRYGPGRQFVKTIWIDETQIHPGQERTREREAYHVIK